MIGKMPNTAWTNGQVDITTPSVARVYDYYLGGSHNFAVDREFAKEAIKKFPAAPDLARRNRTSCSGPCACSPGAAAASSSTSAPASPTAGHVYQIAGELVNEPRVVYVDNEAVAIKHSKIMTADLDEEEASRSGVYAGVGRKPA